MYTIHVLYSKFWSHTMAFWNEQTKMYVVIHSCARDLKCRLPIGHQKLRVTVFERKHEWYLREICSRCIANIILISSLDMFSRTSQEFPGKHLYLFNEMFSLWWRSFLSSDCTVFWVLDPSRDQAQHSEGALFARDRWSRQIRGVPV